VPARAEEPIDRRALVERHNPTLRTFDVESPLSLGNGEFAFTADVTGLQTFPERYEKTIPLTTMSQWGWHTFPNPKNWSIERFAFKEFPALDGRKVGYADIPGDVRTPEIEWLRANPHRLHLGRIGFDLRKADGTAAAPEDLTQIEQTLDLWNGVLKSHFVLEGIPVDVETVVDDFDRVAVRVRSPLVRAGRLAIEIRFPYGTGAATAADWTKPSAHQTELGRVASETATLHRRLDQDAYLVELNWSAGATFTEAEPHRFMLSPAPSVDTLSLVAYFTPGTGIGTHTSADLILLSQQVRWHRFWTSGGAIDLSGSRDPRWRELERRIVLSQYLTAIQCAGTNPPQESGLTFNSWEGKFHLEMHWWHAVHFALWDRLPLLERSLAYYAKIRDEARATAKRQGYAGARWPKMTGPTGKESPSSIGPFLIWQQPHPIYYAELAYRARPGKEALRRYQDIVFDTAEFMASYPAWDEATKRYVLGPTLQCAQERFPKDKTINCTFELVYWRWGLEAAQQWRKRMGLAREPQWDRVLNGLAKPLVVDGKYAFAETAPDSYTNPRWNDDHPAVLGALGVLPGPGVDVDVMRRSFDWIFAKWNWPQTWGWDYPMAAMTAARLGKPERAIDALLLDTPKNVYRVNGHNHQRPGLTIYLPGNGGLLTAVAMMAAGWDGGPTTHAPGFPADGSWTVKWEGLKPMP
jgi:hypothetical protein